MKGYSYTKNDKSDFNEIEVDTSEGDVVITLPPNDSYFIKKISSDDNKVIIKPFRFERIKRPANVDW